MYLLCSLGFVCTSHVVWGSCVCFVVLSVDRVYCSLGFVCTYCVLVYTCCVLWGLCVTGVFSGGCV